MEYYDTFSKLSQEDKLVAMKEMRDQDWFANLEWLEAAELAHKFKNGDQWSDSEKLKLQMQGREPLVWNYIHPAVELASGILSQNPVRIYPYPVEKNDDFLCEILEDIITYVDSNQVDADTEQTDLFENGIITGVGDVVVDVGPNPENPEEIELYERSLEAYEVLVDAMSRKADLSDARRISYEKWVTAEDFKIRYPKHVKDMEEIFTTGASGIGNAIDNDSTYTTSEYTDVNLFEHYDSQNKRVMVTHFEIKEAYKRYYFVDNNGQSKEITKEEATLAKDLPGKLVEVYDTKVYWVHYLYDRILWEGDSPVYKKNFSLCRMYAYMDKSSRKHRPYGLIKHLIDPQKECNRRWMHTLKLLSKQGVGIMAEVDAFLDVDQAQDTWSDPDAITFTTQGGLNKVQEKGVPKFPDAPMRLEEMNKNAMTFISGINPDLMGTAQQRREPGINLKLRQRQGLTMLSKLFENHKKALKEIYKRKVEIITRFMPDAQIRRILGETENYTFQDGMIIDQKRGLIAPIRKVRDLGYNIRMEDAPGGVNKLVAELSIFMEMMEKGFPVDPNTVIDKLELSPIEKANWKAFIGMKQKSGEEAQKVDMMLKQGKLKLDNKKIDSTNAIEAKKLQLLGDTQYKDLDVKTSIEEGKLQQKDKSDKMDFALRVAQMKADEKKDLVEILKFVSQEQSKLEATNINRDASDKGAYAKPAGNKEK